MKTKREILKAKTREQILNTTAQIIVSHGIIDTTTKQIAEACNVAHGTLFAHFSNREELIGQALKAEILRIAQKLREIADTNGSFWELFEKYLSMIADEEGLFLIINKEFPFLSDSVKNEIITTETIVKKFFYNAIATGIDGGIIKPINITLLISSIFGTISHYLTRKEYFIKSESIINQKKDEIIRLYRNLII